eukprot:gene1163-10677_t
MKRLFKPVILKRNFINFSTQNILSPVYKIVLTGGPCGGKSTALSFLTDRLSNLGYRVYNVTEMATLLFLGGAKFSPDMSKDELLTFEASLIKSQLALEDAFYDIAKSTGKKSIVICDRGAMDAVAYMDEDDSEAMMDLNDWNIMKLREIRYDCVIHLVTAAIGAEKYYTNENNTTRLETPKQAAELDLKLRDAWNGHPNFNIIDNSTGFQDKINRVVATVSKSIGLPEPSLVKRKFLMRSSFQIDPNEFPVKCEEVYIEEIFLKVKDPKEQVRIRKRGQKGYFSYHLSQRISDFQHEDDATYRPISARNYVTLLGQADPDYLKIKKKIYSFVYKAYYYELTEFIQPREGMKFLEVESDQNVLLPPFLEEFVKKEVTDRKKYRSISLAKIKEQNDSK